MFRTPTFNLILGLGLCSLGGAMLYVYFRNKEDEDVDLVDGRSQNSPKNITAQLTVPNESIPVLLGRSGANLKIIEEKTSTVIRFRDKDDNHQYCEIQGSRENVHKAKQMLMKDILRSPIVREEIFVPQSAYGKVIGRCGECLQEICRQSLAKVSVETGDRNSGNSNRRLIITGSRTQVNVARKLIEEKVKEDEVCRRSLEESEQKREPRRSPTNSVSSTHSSLVSMNSQVPLREKLSLSDNEKSMEVYVSAVASPAKFWLQLVGPQSRKLDELVDDMTEYYSNKENQAFHKIADPYLGQIVAALFKYDCKWYRAEIIAILPNEYNPRDVVLDLYFVDYGDSEYVAPYEVFELRTDFLTLRFQAIECYLAHVKPALTNDTVAWDQQAIAKFEEVAHVASWKKLISRVVTYKERPKGGNPNHTRREGSPVPGVELFDTSEGNEINIAHLLISQGYAIPDYPNVETNNVLRLGGGDFGNSSNQSTKTASDENIATPAKKDEHRFSRHSQFQNCALSHSTPSEQKITNGKHNGSTTDAGSNSDLFLRNEKLNGNVVPDKSNLLNHNHLNRLIQS